MTEKENEIKLNQHHLAIFKKIKGAELNIKIVMMEKAMEIGSLMHLAPGSVLIFDKSGEMQSAKVKINDQLFAKGVVVQRGERFGISLESLESVAS